MERGVSIVGRRKEGKAVPLVFHLRAATARVCLAWQNAFGDELIAIEDVQLRLLGTDHLPGNSCPAGSVGLIYGDFQQVGDLLRDMTRHYDHYRSSARQFAQAYRELHSPQRLVQEICDVAAESVSGNAGKVA